MIGRPGDLCTTPQIGHSKTQSTPGEFLLRISLASTIDFKVSGMIDGGLYSQHLAFLIVHFERVAVDAVTNPHSFGSLFEGAGNLTLTTGWPTLAKEAQHVGAGKTADRMMKKPGIKSRQA